MTSIKLRKWLCPHMVNEFTSIFSSIDESSIKIKGVYDLSMYWMNENASIKFMSMCSVHDQFFHQLIDEKFDCVQTPSACTFQSKKIADGTPKLPPSLHLCNLNPTFEHNWICFQTPLIFSVFQRLNSYWCAGEGEEGNLEFCQRISSAYIVRC